MKDKLTGFQKKAILITLLAAAFITSMSTTVTVTMIPNMMEYFNVSSSTVQWLTSGATLLSGIIIPITAFLIKRTPNKIYFIAAMAAFTIGSLGAFAANNFTVLLVCRLVQAAGCGMLLSFAQIIILAIFPKEKHGVMMAAYSMAASVSTMVGPTYAGLVIDSVGWRGVFVPLAIIGAVIIILGIIFMKNITPRQKTAINMKYVMLSSAGFASLVIGLNNLSGGAFRLESGGCLLLGIALLIVFSVLQLRSKAPMLNLKVFKRPEFAIGVGISVCLYMICMGNGVLLPILAKTICGFSDTAYGFATIVGALMSVFATFFGGKMYDKFGIKPMAIISISIFGVFSVAGLFVTKDISIVYIGFLYAAQSVAMSMLLSPTTTFSLSGLENQLRVDGSAIFNTLRQISSSIATTVAVLLFTVWGNDINAMHSVYGYFGFIAIVIAVLVVLYTVKIKKKRISA